MKNCYPAKAGARMPKGNQRKAAVKRYNKQKARPVSAATYTISNDMS